jgi:lipoprotein-anchoring transpeptidase ErfK/SrfK
LTRISFRVILSIIMKPSEITRKNFIKLAGIGLTSFALRPQVVFYDQAEFPAYDRLGRVCIIGKVNVKSAPYEDSEIVGVLYEDAVIPWLRDVVATEPNYNFYNQKWVETLDGFVYAANIQPVKNLPNQPVDTLLKTSTGEGMWAEVTVPYADVDLVNGPSSNSWVSTRIEQGLPIRVYYGQVYFIDQIKEENGRKYYRANPNYYGGVDLLWVPAEAMHPISPDEIMPINPDVENKKIIVDVNKQTLSCFEGENEIYYCRVSTGAKYDMYGNLVDKWATPIGSFSVSRKFASLQMSGGTTGAPYDLPGIGWVSIFATGGVAIHATVWHNDFGTPKSHGCVNTLPEDAKWIYRWGLPFVPYDPGMVDVSITGESSTVVQVIES